MLTTVGTNELSYIKHGRSCRIVSQYGDHSVRYPRVQEALVHKAMSEFGNRMLVAPSAMFQKHPTQKAGWEDYRGGGSYAGHMVAIRIHSPTLVICMKWDAQILGC